MKKNYILVLFAIMSLSVHAQDSEYYYWHNSEKQILKIKDEKIYLLINVEINNDSLASKLRIDTQRIENHEKLILSTSIVPIQSVNQSLNSYWAVVQGSGTELNLSLPEIIYHAPFFYSKDGNELGLSHLFYVKLRKSDDIDLLVDMAQKNNVEILGNNRFMPLWFTLACNRTSKGNAMEMANLFFESGQFASAQPDLMKDNLIQCVNDTHFGSQWNLRNTGQHGGTVGSDINICNAWTYTRGCSDIIVAVLDNGLEMNHPDLTNIHPLSFDTETGTSPSIVRGKHGMAVAGIIGANSGNNLGVAGIAPESPLMSISNSMTLAPHLDQQLADGINFAWQNGASVINNSWSSNYLFPEFINDAIQNAVTYGRNGLGTVVVFATGNDNRNSINYPSTNPNVIAVGAVSMCNQRKSPSSCDGENWGSNYGTGLDVVAPGVKIYTTDRQGELGYNEQQGVAGNYFANFNGTSSAAPHVAGIAALVLSVNPSLTWQEVKTIIESTTDKIGNYTYTIGAGEQSNLTWNNQMGYGRVNAYAAVNTAVPRISGPTTVCSSNTIFTLNNLPSIASVTWSHSSNLLYVNGQGTTSYTVKAASPNISGPGWITAKVVHGSSSFTLPSKNIWAGMPHTPTDIIPFWNNGMEFGNDSYYEFRVIPHPSSTYYTWQVDGGT
ncbi:MAG: S8 family serine peptidase, partial [Bacteroidales bacterium]|nr:S8 family serine peptidase [Bacteroidales bacterium]